MVISKKNIIAIIQARLTSSRLPGKVLAKINDKTVIEHIFTRVSESHLIDKVVVATSTDSSDDPLADFCSQKGMLVFRGPLGDVLKRFQLCAEEYKASHILRITGDCPLIDPIILDAVITAALAGNYDCYGLGGDFPDGLDCTLLSANALRVADSNAKLPSEREHVCPYIEKNNTVFKLGVLELFSGMSDKRWTLDEEDDLKLISLIYKHLYQEKKIFYTPEILDWLEQNPAVGEINKHIIRNEGYLKSLNEDIENT
jgi:spore coat polysaccharide biosynthesis protein SpsF